MISEDSHVNSFVKGQFFKNKKAIKTQNLNIRALLK